MIRGVLRNSETSLTGVLTRSKTHGPDKRIQRKPVSGMQTQVIFVTYNGPTMYVALHRDLSLSHSRRETRIVMYSGVGICDERDCVSFHSEQSMIQLVLSMICDECNCVSVYGTW